MTKEDQLAFTQYLRTYITPSKQEKVEQVLNQRTRYVAVVLENIFQAHNASAIIRTAECFGLQDVHFVENKYDIKLINTVAMGASKWMNIEHYKTTHACIEKLRQDGYRIVATTLADNACLLSELPVEGKMAVFFGTESSGLSEHVLQQADECVKIPMYGFTQSFNISVSVAIFLQYTMSALRNSLVPWQLSKEEKDALRLQWFSRIVRWSDQHKKKFLAQKNKLFFRKVYSSKE